LQRAEVKVVVELGKEWGFDDLLPGTIALDGAVQGPRLDPENERFSFDHHAECIRLVTTATCQQVFDALLLGLDPTGMTILINDLDGDTVLSAWLLGRHQTWRDPQQRERVRPLVSNLALADAHGPAYPLPDPRLARHFHLVILEPLRQARNASFPRGPGRVLDELFDSMDDWWLRGLPTEEIAPPAGTPPRITSCEGFALVEYPPGQEGPSSFGVPWLYDRGHDRLVLVTPLPGGRFRYGLARRSDLVPRFPLPLMYPVLNQTELTARASPLSPGQTWGGGSSVGGSPRDGSVLEPSRVAQCIGKVLRSIRASPD